MTYRGITVVLLTLVSASGCQLVNDKPAETSAPKPPIVERGPLPAEEQPPPPPEEHVAEAPPAEAKPVEPGIASTGSPTRGTLPKAVVDEKLKSAQPGIRACYQTALQTKPTLRGLVNINFVVAPDGKVAHAEAVEGEGSLNDARTVECILNQIEKLEFPSPSGGRVFLNYPVQLEPPK